MSGGSNLLLLYRRRGGQAPPVISYAGSPFTWNLGIAISTANVTSSGGPVTSYAVTVGALPTGISLNTSTGAITGTPTADDGSSPVTISATGPGGVGTAQITVTVVDTMVELFPTASATPLITEFSAARAYCYTDAGADLESGSSQYFSKTSPTFTPTNKMTIRLSFKPESIGANQDLAGRWSGANTNNQFILRVNASGTVRLFIADALTDAGSNYATGAAVLVAGNQYEVVVIYDGSLAAADRVAIYVNGVADTVSVTGTIAASLTASTNVLSIGFAAVYADGIFQCFGIAASALSGAALTAAHTATFYDDQAAARQAEWMSFWNLCEASGAREDSKGVNDLTATGTPGVGVGPATGLVQDRAPCKQVTAVAGVESAKPLLQATLASQPIWIDGANPYLDGDGSNDAMATAAFAASVAQPDVLLVRCKTDALTANRSFTDNEQAATRHRVSVGTAGADWRFQAGAAVDRGTAGTADIKLTVKWNGASSLLRENGVQAGAAGNAGANARTGLRILDDGSGGFMNGRLYHIAVVSGDLSDAQMTAAEALL